MDELARVLSRTWGWPEGSGSSNLEMLFPGGLDAACAEAPLPQQEEPAQRQQQQLQPAVAPPLTPPLCSPFVGPPPAARPPPRLASPFAGFSLAALATPARGAAAGPAHLALQQQLMLHAQQQLLSLQPAGAPLHMVVPQLADTAAGVKRSRGADRQQRQPQQQQPLPPPQPQPLPPPPQQQLQQEPPPPPRRRGRPPKGDGHVYSEAYLALRRYRARKKNEMHDMEAAVAAKAAQLRQLEAENSALLAKRDALEHTLFVQDRMVQALSAMRLQGKPPASDAAAAESHASSDAGRAERAAAAARALVAAITGEPQPLPDSSAEPGVAPAPGKAAAGPDELASLLGPRPPMPPPSLGCQDVPRLLERYKDYVSESALALSRVAAAMHTAGQLPASEAVALASMAALDDEAVAGLGITLPCWPLTLAEYLVLGSEDRVPPALPSINLLTGQHETIEPEIWRTVARQVQLRPWQVPKVRAAWQLYAASLEAIHSQRLGLMARLQEALSAGAPGDARSSERLASEVLLRDEYAELAEAISTNLAREDTVMLVFDFAIGKLLETAQLCLLCVAGWPFITILGAVTKWWIQELDGGEEEQEEAAA